MLKGLDPYQPLAHEHSQQLRREAAVRQLLKRC
jgi:hypothetical protein